MFVYDRAVKSSTMLYTCECCIGYDETEYKGFIIKPNNTQKMIKANDDDDSHIN